MEAIPKASDLIAEIEFMVSRSSGPGGQNVNKVNSRITVKFDVRNSSLLTADQKRSLEKRLSSRMTREGILMFSVQDYRSQLQNKEQALERLDEMLMHALTPPKKRRKTNPTKSSSRKRVESKKRHGEKKKWRKNVD
jgi:ribosome-associated protein